MEIKGYLFIGGCKDGEIEAISNDSYYVKFVKPIKDFLPDFARNIDFYNEVPLEIERYVKRRFIIGNESENEQFFVFAIENMSNVEIFKKLLINYSSNPSKESCK